MKSFTASRVGGAKFRIHDFAFLCPPPPDLLPVLNDWFLSARKGEGSFNSGVGGKWVICGQILDIDTGPSPRLLCTDKLSKRKHAKNVTALTAEALSRPREKQWM